MVGRAMTDIQKMSGEFEGPEISGEMSVLTGKAPAGEMRDYQMEVNSYTRGQGKLTCTFRGYEPCHNAEVVIEEKGYDPERDLENPPGSVFCAHGAGFAVPWDQAPAYMHIESTFKGRARSAAESGGYQDGRGISRDPADMRTAQTESLAQTAAKPASVPERDTPASFSREEEKELEEIFIRTYGKVERKTPSCSQKVTSPPRQKHRREERPVREYLLVDGYNVIFAWEDLKELAEVNIEAARNKLMDILCNYQGFRKCTVILVFDAYKVEGYALEIQKYHNIHVVYTKQAETADQYIEKVVHQIAGRYHVTVVTSDGVEQVVTLGQGGTLISSREFREEVETVRRQIREEYESRRESGKNYLFDHMDEELARRMEDVRLGRKKV